MSVAQPEGNYFNKYENKGMIISLIMKGFFSNLDHLLSSSDYNTVYEAGCGEGYISKHIYDYCCQRNKRVEICASDLSESIINKAKLDFPQIQFHTNSIYNLQELDEAFDLVVACEVLEHLENPRDALMELFRISKRYVLVSVPDEPIWCIANFARGKYIRSFGNTPRHINHWNRKAITRLVSGYGSIIEVRSPFPWTMVLCEKNKRSPETY